MASKKHYDISMSRRTRRPKRVLQETSQDLTVPKPQSEEGEGERGGGSGDRKSLNQLMEGDQKELGAMSSLSQRFDKDKEEEEKQLQLVRTKQKNGDQGTKLKGMVVRYVKVLSNVIKAKHEPHLAQRKKPLLRWIS